MNGEDQRIMAVLKVMKASRSQDSSSASEAISAQDRSRASDRSLPGEETKEERSCSSFNLNYDPSMGSVKPGRQEIVNEESRVRE